MGLQALFNPQMRALNLRVRVAIDGEYVRASALEVSVLVCVWCSQVVPFVAHLGVAPTWAGVSCCRGEGMVVVVVVVV
jgi:hypothetical protein